MRPRASTGTTPTASTSGAPISWTRRGRRTSSVFLLSGLAQLVASSRSALASVPLRTEDLARRRRTPVLSSSPSEGRQGKVGTQPLALSSEGALESFLEARSLVARGDYNLAFNQYENVVRNAPSSSAIAEYARLGRAITRYEVGNKGQAVIELEYEVLNNVGIPEAHAALAAACWSSGKTSLAEFQWEVAMEFDSRFSNVRWVSENYHWGPELTGALQKFLSLTK